MTHAMTGSCAARTRSIALCNVGEGRGAVRSRCRIDPHDHVRLTRSRSERLSWRAPRPAIPRRPSIDEYSDEELVALVHWVQSDGRLLTDDEIVRRVIVDLGFQRRGARIEAAIRRGIELIRGPLQ